SAVSRPSRHASRPAKLQYAARLTATAYGRVGRDTMDAAQKAYLEQRYNAREWYGRGRRGRRSLQGFSFDASELPGWTLQRIRRDVQARPPVLRSLWSRGDTMSALLAIDVFQCASVRSAHEQLLEALGNIESDAVERRTAPNAPGDVAFAL